MTRLGSGSSDNAPNAFVAGSTVTSSGTLNAIWLAAINKGYVLSHSGHGQSQFKQHNSFLLKRLFYWGCVQFSCLVDF